MLAILCSGQGAQHRDMFSLTGQSREAEAIFEAAATHLGGTDPRVLVRTAPEAACFDNRTGQLLCCTQALAAWAALQPLWPARIVMAGYSVGELAAWGCAGCLSADDTLRLAARRAEYMDAASPGNCGMLGVTGLRAAVLEPLAEGHGLHIAIANDAESFVLGGTLVDIDAFADAARQTGASTVKRLRIAVPSHTKLVAHAVQPFADALQNARPIAPRGGVRLLSGIDAERVIRVDDGARKLAAQLAQTIHWGECQQAILECGVSAVLELGPGDALCRMMRRRAGMPTVRAVDEFRQIDGLRGWVASLR